MNAKVIDLTPVRNDNYVKAMWGDVKRLFDKMTEFHTKERECWPQFCAYMTKLRDDCPSDQDFGAECTRNGIEPIDPNDRAAAVWLGRLTAAALEDAMAKCDRRSLRTFRAEVESWNDDYFKPVSQNVKPTAPASKPEDKPETTASAADSPKSADQETIKPISSRTPWHDYPSAEKVWNIYREVHTRSTLGRVNRKHGWQLILLAIANEWAQVNERNISKPTARLLVPFIVPQGGAGEFLDGFDLTTPKGCKRTEDEFVPFLEAYFDKVKADPKRIGWLFDEWKREVRGVVQPVSEEQQERAAKIQADALAAFNARPTPPHCAPRWFPELPGGLPEKATLTDGKELELKPIIVCGKQVYPSRHANKMSYIEAYAIVTMIKHLIMNFGDKRASQIGHVISTEGTLVMFRFIPEIAELLSAVGVAINIAGDSMPQSQWFDMAHIPPKTANY